MNTIVCVYVCLLCLCAGECVSVCGPGMCVPYGVQMSPQCDAYPFFDLMTIISGDQEADPLGRDWGAGPLGGDRGAGPLSGDP